MSEIGDKHEVTPTDPKERASVWAKKGLPWAAREYLDIAGIVGKDRDEVMAAAHAKAAERYKRPVDEGQSSRPGGLMERDGLSALVSEWMKGRLDKHFFGGMLDFLNHTRVVVGASFEEFRLNNEAHKEFAGYYAVGESKG